MDVEDIAGYVLVNSDQAGAILKHEEGRAHLEALMERISALRNLLIAENNVAPEIADSTIISMTSVLIALQQLEHEDDPE